MHSPTPSEVMELMNFLIKTAARSVGHAPNEDGTVPIDVLKKGFFNIGLHNILAPNSDSFRIIFPIENN